MEFRSGDLLVWRSTNQYDLLSESIIMLDGLHSGIVLKGRRLERYSACGRSPTDTYVTFLVDSLYPIEEVVGHIWHRPNGAALHHIRRVGGREISDREAYSVFTEYRSMKKRPFSSSVYISIVAYFRLGEMVHKTGHEGKRWNLCSLLSGWCLERFGFLSDDCVVNNLLPIDFISLTFYQRENYVVDCLFDKGTYRLEWFLSSLLISMGIVSVEPVSSPIVDELLKGYNYPRDVKPSVKEYADTYLTEDG